jgi:hypothetical protein
MYTKSGNFLKYSKEFWGFVFIKAKVLEPRVFLVDDIFEILMVSKVAST